MRVALMALALWVAGLAIPPVANAQPVVTDDPATYAATIARQMQTEDVAPLRYIFAELSGGQVSTNVDANLMAFERAIAHREARLAQQIEDITLSDTVRQIYYYHYYGDNTWLFTRFEFARVGEQSWALTGLTFSASWTGIVLGVTPGFQPTPATPQ